MRRSAAWTVLAIVAVALALLVTPSREAACQGCGPDAIENQTPPDCGSGANCAEAEAALVNRLHNHINCAGLCEENLILTDECFFNTVTCQYQTCGYIDYKCDLLEY